MNLKEIAIIQERLKQLEVERSKLESRLAELQTMCASGEAEAQTKGLVTNLSGVSEKIALFRSLFLGREDVFPKRWQNARTGKAGYAPACGNEWVSGICGKPKVKCGECPNQDFLRITDEVIDGHLRGRQTIGVYPMLADGACWFLAADFDKQTWQRDAEAFLATCQSKQVPSALERSRSGNGGHVWIFFAEPVPVPLARRLGAHLLTETMKREPDIGFESYDRLFPNQDTMPDGGFGNLIALPLQHGPRQNGNSVFLDESFEPYRDQWAFLSSLSRLTLAQAIAVVEAADRQDQVIDLRQPLDEENEEPRGEPLSRLKLVPDIAAPLPKSLDVVLGNQIYIPRAGLPPGLINRLIRLAAFQNPAFYRAQAMRLSTFGIPRVISCGELLSRHIALPRGNREEMEQLFKELDIRVNLRDERYPGHKIKADFLGEFQLSAEIGEKHIAIQRIYADLSTDEKRNTLIFNDVLKTLDEQRSPVIITERKDHALLLAGKLTRFARNVLFLHGGMGVRQRREMMQRLEEIAETEERVLIATGRYIGEGFDDARLDTLFLAMPVSWKGVLAQYVGRLHRPHPRKREVLVYDYVDTAVPILRRMSEKRLRGYENLGYFVENAGG